MIKRIAYLGLAAGLIWPVLAVGDANAENLVQVRLYSPDIGVDVRGSAPIDGDYATVHVQGDTTDATVTVHVNRKRNDANVDVSGTIWRGCTSPRQSMAGLDGIINGELQVDMTLECRGYRTIGFHADIVLSPPRLIIPPSDNGQSAALIP